MLAIVGGLGGLIGAAGGLSAFVAWRKFKHQQPIESQNAVWESFERQISSAEKLGDKPEVERLRREQAQQEEAWRAQQGVRSKVPKILGPGEPALTGEEGKALRSLLKAAQPLVMMKASDWITRGNAQYQLGDYEAALHAYNSSIELDPGRAVSHINLASALLRLGRKPEALAECDRALQLSPGDPMAQFNKARALSGLRKGEKALDWLTEVVVSHAEYRKVAKTDPDLFYIREHPDYGQRFWELVGEESEDDTEDE